MKIIGLLLSLPTLYPYYAIGIVSGIVLIVLCEYFRKNKEVWG